MSERSPYTDRSRMSKTAPNAPPVWTPGEGSIQWAAYTGDDPDLAYALADRERVNDCHIIVDEATLVSLDRTSSDGTRDR